MAVGFTAEKAEEIGKPLSSFPCALSDIQLQAVQLIAMGVPQVRIAQQLNVTQQTISEWKLRPSFRFELQRLRDCSRREAEDLLRGVVKTAAETVASLMTTSEKEEIRLRAALAVLELDRRRPPPDMPPVEDQTPTTAQLKMMVMKVLHRVGEKMEAESGHLATPQGDRSGAGYREHFAR